MKKLILTLTLLLGFMFIFGEHAQAQIYNFKATSFACKVKNDYGYWTDWTDWTPCTNLYIKMNCNDNTVYINSTTPQVYHITKYVRNYYDENGGHQAELRFYDQDYDRGTMRLRTESNGNTQVYIDFANVMWVYNVKKL